MPKEPILHTENLSVTYEADSKPAIDNVSIQVMEGEFVSLVGPTDAGKTTLCLCFNGLIPNMIMQHEYRGRVTVDGVNPSEREVYEMAEKVGIVLDDPEPQMTQMTVKEEIAFGLQNLGVPREEMLRRVADILDIVGLKGLDDRNPTELSGGQMQRLAIGSALATYPKIMVLDEPTSNLDPVGKTEVFETLSKLKERGKTIILTSHEMERIATFSDKIYLMNGGKIIIGGAPREIFKNVDEFVRVGEFVPQVTELAHNLKLAKKWPFDDYPVETGTAHERISSAFRIK
jgi:energy-coupling factor transport system ATP-binding protein